MTVSSAVGVDRIGAGERIASLDVLRGIAILFILFMNMAWMASYGPFLRDPRIPSWTSFDQGAFSFMIMLVGTQRGLLELLFGAGIMIMARKAMQPDGPVAVADLHYRRNWLLILLGLFNGFVLLWIGDILLPYGLTALLLFQFRMIGWRGQLGLAAAFLALSLTLPVHEYISRSEAKAAAAQVVQLKAANKPVSDEIKAKADEWDKAIKAQVPIAANPEKQKKAATIHAERTAPVFQYVKNIWADWLKLNDDALGLLCLFAEIAGTMLIGMALFRLGIIQGNASLATYVALLVIGYGTGIPMRIAGLQQIFLFNAEPKIWWITSEISRLSMTLGHVGLIHLALRSGAGRLLLAPFQAAGKIPLTTYLFTSFLMFWILLPGFGFALHGRWGWGGMITMAAIIIAAEVVATNLWLRWYETGPMEWLWKSAAYGRRMPFRKRREEPNIPLGLVPAE